MGNNDINFQPVFDYLDKQHNAFKEELTQQNQAFKEELKEYIDDSISKAIKPVFEYIDTKNEELLEEVDKRISARIDPLIKAVDSMIAETRKYHQEMEAYKHQFQVLKDWAVEVSKKVGVPLPF